MKRRPAAEDGSLELAVALLILIILLSLVMYTAFIATGFASGTSARTGMARAMDMLVPDGPVIGYADLSGTLGQVRVNNPRPSPAQLGAVRVPVRLASLRLAWEQGTGANLGNATVIFTSPAGTETLPGSSGPVLKKPAWAIVQKGSTVPGQSDNGNDLLEPNEVFVLFIYPSSPLPPDTRFRVGIRIPDQNPLELTRMVPDPVTPVMDLG
jgi:hypothetical protein